MNHIDERTLALFVSGDLDAQTAADAEAHLSDCSSCKALLASFSASGQWLRSLSTAPDARELAALRAGTLSRIAARPRRRLWLAASGIAAALAVAAVLFASRYLTRVAQPPVVAEIPPPPAEQAPGAVPEIAKVQPGVKSIRAKARARSDRPRARIRFSHFAKRRSADFEDENQRSECSDSLGDERQLTPAGG